MEKAYPRFFILAVILFVVTAGILAGCSGESNEATEEHPQTEVIYADDSVINDFLIQYNSVYPENQISSSSISKYHHHGSDHDNQIQTKINGTYVTISSEGYEGSNGVSVFFESPRRTDESVDFNHEMFKIILKALDSSLTNEQIEEYWNTVIDNGTFDTDLPKDIEVQPGTPHSYDVPGSYGYMKIYKHSAL